MKLFVMNTLLLTVTTNTVGIPETGDNKHFDIMLSIMLIAVIIAIFARILWLGSKKRGNDRKGSRKENRNKE